MPGFCIAIEPMVTLGTAKTHVLADDWTVKTNDGTLVRHWEHSVALTEEGPLVLTARGRRQGEAGRAGHHGRARPAGLSRPSVAPGRGP